MHGPGVDELIAEYAGGDGEREYAPLPVQGSIVAISAGSGGTLLTANTYDAYGVRAETVRCYDERPDPAPHLGQSARAACRR